MKARFVVPIISLLVIATPAHAATFVVTKASDSFDGACNADCSLREAVQAADADATADEVVLPAGVLQLELSPAGADNSGESGDLDVTGDLTIRGQGVDATVKSTIATRVFDVIGPGVDLQLRDLTVTGGHPPLDEGGGGIRAMGSGELSLERVIVRDNVVVGTALGYGGGILKAGGRLTMRDSAILGNRAEGSGYGGGILLTDASTSADLTNVTIAENLANKGGGGVYFNNAIATNFVNVTIVNNEANEFGGGLGADLSLARLRSSIVTANVAPSGADCSSPGPASDGGNVGPAACGFTQPTDLNPADPGLGPLSTSGVPVREPLPGSPAVDHAVGPCPPTDARGVARPQGPACDSGAAELPAPPSRRSRDFCVSPNASSSRAPKCPCRSAAPLDPLATAA